jgi:hypothetical protein
MTGGFLVQQKKLHACRRTKKFERHTYTTNDVLFWDSLAGPMLRCTYICLAELNRYFIIFGLSY